MENIYEYSSSEESDAPELPPVSDISIYLENHHNLANMSSIFLYIPWGPSLPVINQLKQICSKTMKHIQHRRPDLSQRYNWNMVGTPSRGMEGSSSITNSYLLRNHHITLFPNIKGEKYKMEQYVENVATSVRKMPVPQGLIKVDAHESERISNLNKILFKSSPPGDRANEKKRFITLKFEPYLSFYRSSTSSSLFIAGKLSLTPDTAKFFESLNHIIVENMDLLDLKKEDSPTDQEYHVSLMLGELKRLDSNNLEMDELVSLIKELDFTKDLADIDVSINSLRIREIATSRNSYEVEFSI